MDTLARTRPATRRRWLTQRQVAQADIGQRLQNPPDLRDVGERLQCLADPHAEDIGDRLFLVADLERFRVISAAVTNVALDPDVGQEVHLNQLLPIALARLAAAARLVEREPPGRVAADLGLRQLREELPDEVEDAGVSSRVRAG